MRRMNKVLPEIVPCPSSGARQTRHTYTDPPISRPARGHPSFPCGRPKPRRGRWPIHIEQRVRNVYYGYKRTRREQSSTEQKFWAVKSIRRNSPKHIHTPILTKVVRKKQKSANEKTKGDRGVPIQYIIGGIMDWIMGYPNGVGGYPKGVYKRMG
jgi:hypothetical protein